MSAAGFRANFSADVEQDCPPYLTTTRGMTEGLPRLLDLLGELGVRGTFFTTGEMARRFPAIIRRLVGEGHELGCHGDLHRDFTALTGAEADAELGAALASLREFAPVASFRAPYLRFPAAYLPRLGAWIHSLAVEFDHWATAARDSGRINKWISDGVVVAGKLWALLKNLGGAILGIFRGSPLGQKAAMDPWSHFPSSIVLYQKNLERQARDRDELIEEIRVTLMHEVGHFLGLDEDELYARGLD